LISRRLAANLELLIASKSSEFSWLSWPVCREHSNYTLSSS